MLLQESVVGGRRVVLAPGLQHCPGRIPLQDRPSPLPLHLSPLHNPLQSLKAASGRV